MKNQNLEEELEDVHVTEVDPLRSPRRIKDEVPLGDAAAATVLGARRELREILRGRDRDRIAVVVGPCSIDDPEAALDYARRLVRAAEPLRDRLVIVMRTYFEKARTTIGWKGLINDPGLDGSCDVDRGLELARRVLVEINGLGLPCGTDFLDRITPQYLGDAVSWAAIGARTTESQTHREMASGLSMPVGFKNGTDGGLDIAKNAMISAGHPHAFLGIDEGGATAVIRTRGNPDRHVVLRGGSAGTNFGADDIARAAKMVEGEGIARPVMVDCSHGNSAKDYRRQSGVARDVADSFCHGESRVMGVLIESHLEAGRQDWDSATRRYGVSITDACIGWDETAQLLEEIAGRIAEARRKRACA